MRTCGLWRVRLVLLAGMLAVGLLVVGSVGAGASLPHRVVRREPSGLFAGGRGGFSPTPRQLRGSELRIPRVHGVATPMRAGTEVARLRRVNSDTFLAGSGRLVTRVYPFAVNYRTASGAFARIDGRLRPSGSGYAQRANDLGVRLPATASSLARVSDAAGGLAFGLSGAAGTGRVSGRVETFAGAGTSPGLAYASLNSGVGWQATTPTGTQGLSWTVHPSPGLSARLVRTGVAFVTRRGRVAWEFAAPSATVGRSRRSVPTVLSVHHSGRAVVISVRVATSGGRGRHRGSRRRFASLDLSQAPAAHAVPVALVNPSPVTWGGEVVQGSSVSVGTITGDCYLDSGSPDTSFCMSSTNYVGSADHTLLNFDVAGSVPSHVQVLQAFVSMTLESESTSTAEQVGVWQAAQPWTNFATWNTYDGSNSWTTPGGDTTGAEQDHASIGASADVGKAFSWNINAIVQGWVDGNPAQVDGLYFAAESGASAPNQLGFYTETASPAQIPYVEVYYEPRMGDYPSAQYASQPLTDRSTLGVSEATGNLLVSNSDLHLAGVNGLDLNVGRYYNDLSTDQDSFGVGWSMDAGADSYLAVPCDDASTVAYFDGTGNAQTFYVDPVTGQPVNPPGVDAQLSMSSPNNSYNSSTFTLLFRHSGITETFTKPASSCNQVAALQSITNRANDTISYHYTSGKLTSITDSYGNTTTISYTGGYVSQITDPTGRSAYYWQNTSGQLTKYEDPAGNYTYYTYDANGNLTEIQTPQGNIVKVHYDTASTNDVTAVIRYVKPTDTSGPKTTYQYAVASGTCPANPGWMQATVKDPDGHVSTYCSDDLSRIAESINANGNIRSACYSPDGFPQISVSPLGTLTTETYSTDGRDNITGIQQGGSSTMTCNGTSGGTGSGLTENLGYTDTTHNPYLPTSLQDPESNTTSYGYDPSTGNTTSVANGSSSATLTYDTTAGINYGTIATSTDPDGATTTYTPSSGNITTVTPPSGSGRNTIHLSYDSANRLKEISTVSGGTGHEVDYSYDALDREHTATYKNASGATVATITYTYDADGNLIRRDETTPNPTSAYVGKIASATAPSGGTTATLTVGAGGVKAGDAVILAVHTSNATTAPSATDSAGNTYHVDKGPIPDTGGDATTILSAQNVKALSSGQQITVTMPSNSEYFVDAQEFSGLTGTTDGSSSAGAKNNTAVNSGAMSTTTAGDLLFGAIGWESGSVPSALGGASWTANTPLSSGGDGLQDYYATAASAGSYSLTATDTGSYPTWMAGLVAYTTNGSGGGTTQTTSYSYDGLDRVTQVTDPDATQTKYGYDAAGNLTTLTDAGGTVTYKYDKANEQTSVTDPGASKPAAAMTYDKDGNLLKTTYASGASMSYAYNAEDQLIYQTDTYKTASGTIAHLSWGSPSSHIQYDGSLISSVLDQAGNTTTYTYDSLDRLTEAKTTNGSTDLADYQYTLDPAGNLLSLDTDGSSVPNGTTSYAYRPGNETCWSYAGTSTNACGSPPSGAHSYAYDADGNQTSNGNGLTATYNALGQTASITSGGTTTNYSYLGEGQDELSNEASSTLHNDGLGLASTTTGTTTNHYTRSTNGAQIDERTSTATYDYLYDDTGNVIGLLDSAGHLANQYTYDPYGNKTTVSSSAPNPFAFQNGYQTTSGLIHFGARYLNPGDGRWSQEDPLNQAQDLTQSNSYGFAGEDPTNQGDACGQLSVPSWVIGLAKDAGKYVPGVSLSCVYAHFIAWTVHHHNQYYFGGERPSLSNFIGWAWDCSWVKSILDAF